MLKYRKTTITITTVLILIVINICGLSQAAAQISTHTITAKGTIVNSVTYFQASFSRPGTTNNYLLGQAWPTIEPCPYPIEKGTWNWVVVNNGSSLKIVPDPAKQDSTCLQMAFNPSGSPLMGDQYAKLYECQAREKSLWAEPYGTTKEAYWKMSYWFPSNFNITQPWAWRLIWQYCGIDGIFGVNTNGPQFALQFDSKNLNLGMNGYYYTDGKDRLFPLMSISTLPKDTWVTIVIYAKQGTTFQTNDGIIDIWINNKSVFHNNALPTASYTGSPYVVWGIANYGGSDQATNQYINVKDVTVTSYFPY